MLRIKQDGKALVISDGNESFRIGVELHWEEDRGHGGGEYISEASLFVKKIPIE